MISSVKYLTLALALTLTAEAAQAQSSGALVPAQASGTSAPAQRQVRTFVPERNPLGDLFSFEEVAGSRTRNVRPREWCPATEEPSSRAVSRDGSLYVDGEVVARAEGAVSFGTLVSRNEFGCCEGIFWNPDSSRVAFYRKDESGVRDYTLTDITSAGVKNVKYPFVGETSERVALGVYNLRNRRTVYLQTDACYITNVTWNPGGRFIYAITGDRSQHNWKLQKFDAVDGVLVRTVLYEHNDAWVEPYEPIHFLPGGRKFIYSTDNRDGYKSLYVCTDRGVQYRLDTGCADACFLGIRDSYVYYTGYAVSPSNPQLFRIAADGKSGPELMTNGRGAHKIYFKEDGYVDVFSSTADAGWSVKCDFGGRVLDTLARGGDPLNSYACCALEYGTIKSADGKFDNNYRMIYPLGFNPSRKYPLLIYVYGGPHKDMVSDCYMAKYRPWEMYMAQRGYLVYVQDNRGTPNHSLAYEQAVNRQLGRLEMDDQMVGIRSLLKEKWVDADRVGVCGWSYGGFMTLSLMTSYPELFAAGACGGPVIDWKWYEVMYGERYMDNPETNPEGFEAVSLMGRADKLNAPLLVCQGLKDEIVLPHNALNFVQECIEKGVCVEFMPYPLSEHNVTGPWRKQLYRTWTEFFNRNLNVKNN